MGINRNILECKVFWLDDTIYFFHSVLIETYWNVKGLDACGAACPGLVLIETYWNVKVTSST